MKRYRKKPVVISAVQWDGNSDTALRGTGISQVTISTIDGALSINTLEGTMICNIGDWIIRGIKGELYPCRDDVFKATHEPVQANREYQEPTEQDVLRAHIRHDIFIIDYDKQAEKYAIYDGHMDLQDHVTREEAFAEMRKRTEITVSDAELSAGVDAFLKSTHKSFYDQIAAAILAAKQAEIGGSHV